MAILQRASSEWHGLKTAAYEMGHAVYQQAKGDLVDSDLIRYDQLRSFLRETDIEIGHCSYSSGGITGPSGNGVYDSSKRMVEHRLHAPTSSERDNRATLDFVYDDDTNHLHIYSRVAFKRADVPPMVLARNRAYRVEADLGPVPPEEVDDYVDELKELANMPIEDFRDAHPPEELSDVPYDNKPELRELYSGFEQETEEEQLNAAVREQEEEANTDQYDISDEEVEETLRELESEMEEE